MYYHTMTALNDIGLDGAPFTVAGPDVYSRIKAVMRRFDDEYMSTLVGEDFRGAVPGRIMQAPEMVELVSSRQFAHLRANMKSFAHSPRSERRSLCRAANRLA